MGTVDCGSCMLQLAVTRCTRRYAGPKRLHPEFLTFVMRWVESWT